MYKVESGGSWKMEMGLDKHRISLDRSRKFAKLKEMVKRSVLILPFNSYIKYISPLVFQNISVLYELR